MIKAQFDVNLFDPAVVADPYPAYEEIRSIGRVVWNNTLGVWMVPGYDDAMEMLTDNGERFKEMNNGELTPWFEGANMIAVDGVEHTRLRRGLSPYSSPVRQSPGGPEGWKKLSRSSLYLL